MQRKPAWHDQAERALSDWGDVDGQTTIWDHLTEEDTDPCTETTTTNDSIETSDPPTWTLF